MDNRIIIAHFSAFDNNIFIIALQAFSEMQKGQPARAVPQLLMIIPE